MTSAGGQRHHLAGLEPVSGLLGPVVGDVIGVWRSVSSGAGHLPPPGATTPRPHPAAPIWRLYRSSDGQQTARPDSRETGRECGEFAVSP